MPNKRGFRFNQTYYGLIDKLLGSAHDLSTAFVSPLHALPRLSGDPFSPGPNLGPDPFPPAIDTTDRSGLSLLFNGDLSLCSKWITDRTR